jgi:hypothetical protein
VFNAFDGEKSPEVVVMNHKLAEMFCPAGRGGKAINREGDGGAADRV